MRLILNLLSAVSIDLLQSIGNICLVLVCFFGLGLNQDLGSDSTKS